MSSVTMEKNRMYISQKDLPFEDTHMKCRAKRENNLSVSGIFIFNTEKV